MYQEDIRDIQNQKREAKRYILEDFFSIYLRMKWFFPHLEKERESLVSLVRRYFEMDENETEVLKEIQKYYGQRDCHDGIDELLDDFDERFEHIYQYCQDTFEDYESVLVEYGDFFSLLELRIRSLLTKTPYEPGIEYRHRMKERPIDFPIFDEAYKEKLLKLVPQLPEPVEEDF